MAVQISGNDITVPRDGSFTRNVTIGGVLTYEDVTNVDSVGLVTARSGLEIGARPGVAASISVDGNMIVSGISTFNGDVKLDGGNLVLGDSGGSNDDRIKIGASGDLSIYHDGSNSYIIDSGTGDLIINTDSTISLNPNSGGHYGLRVISNGSCELYEANSKKLETTSTGISVTGVVAPAADDSHDLGTTSVRWQDLYLSNSVDLADDAKLLCGNSDDLKIYHNGTNSIIQNTEGNLRIEAKTGELAINIVPDADVALYYNNSKKLETQNAGVEITGKLTFANDGLANGSIDLGADADLNLYHDNSDAYFDNNTGDFYIRNAGSNPNQIYIQGKGGENSIVVNGDGSVELYHDNALRLFTGSSYVTVRSNHSYYGYLKLESSNGNNDGLVQVWSNGSDDEIGFSHVDQAGGWFIRCDRNNAGSQTIYQFANTLPSANNTYNLGSSSYRWGTLYASNATNTSDRNEKNTIKESDLGLDFICKLKPVSYKWNQKEGEDLDTKTHYGLISQDVEEAVIETGKTLDDFGAIDKPEGDAMGLSYNEFISPLVKAVQELSAENTALKARLDAAGL